MVWVVVAIIIVAAIAATGWIWYERERTRRLQTRFGPEYDRAVQEYGPKRAAAELARRQKRVEALPIRDLTPAERERFAEAWKAQQARFVDDPEGAVAEADQLCAEVMQARGYPVSDFEQRAADISVEHPRVVEHYRAAHQTALRRTQVSTEELRAALVHYRALFQDLLGERTRVAGGE